VRSAPHTIRLLTPLFLPVAGARRLGGVCARAPHAARGLLVLGLASLHLALGTRLLETWRRTDRADAPFVLVDLAPARRLLEASGVRHAYASYGPAFRLTWESGERIVASPPWNDRFRHWPLPLLDEVRFAKNVAWVLTPSVAVGASAPDELEQALDAIGGRWRRDEAGAAVVFHAFVPPYAPPSSRGRAPGQRETPTCARSSSRPRARRSSCGSRRRARSRRSRSRPRSTGRGFRAAPTCR
jgi:hypothetical protein